MSESEEIRWRVGGAEEAGQVEEAAVLAEEDDEEHKKEELQQRANLGHALRFIPHKKEESDQKFIRNIHRYHQLSAGYNLVSTDLQ